MKVRAIADELHFDRADFIAVKTAYGKISRPGSSPTRS